VNTIKKRLVKKFFKKGKNHETKWHKRCVVNYFPVPQYVGTGLGQAWDNLGQADFGFGIWDFGLPILKLPSLIRRVPEGRLSPTGW
jgi:hypothetical protein